MAKKTGLHLKRKPTLSPQQQFEVVRDEVQAAYQRVADRHVEQREAVKSNRNGRFEFKGAARAEGTVVSTRVWLDNAGQSLGRYGKTVGDLWGWLNSGTGIYGPKKKHYGIYPRFKQALKFVVDGVEYIRKYVFNPKKRTHPGMKGQKHTPRINKSLVGFEKKEVNRGFQRAWKKLGRRR